MPYVDLKTEIQQAPESPGVYQMRSDAGKILYIGKARNLRKRLHSYLRSGLDSKTQRLLARVESFETVLVKSESEALLLEAELIKKHQPRYNILLKDDKSYPYLFFSTQHPSPRIDFKRGDKKEPGRYFGPYPSAKPVRENITTLQKIFKIRTCQDSVFSGRSRPCLQHQIARCSAPCVNKISADAYQEQVKHAILFLEGKDEVVIKTITEKMQLAAQDKQYERAAVYRDQISQLRLLQRSPDAKGLGLSIDAIAIAMSAAKAVVAVISVRDGRLIGGRSYKPQLSGLEFSEEVVLEAFLTQYYFNDIRGNSLPNAILLASQINSKSALEAALKLHWKQKIQIKDQRFRDEKEWVEMVKTTAAENLSQWLHAQESVKKQLGELQNLLKTDSLPTRIECFDISHTSGEETVASCVVFSGLQMDRKAYRRFNISVENSGSDDYAAMKEAVRRRYTRLLRDNANLPDVLLIDGGKGQLRQAAEVMDELGINSIVLMSIAKGPKRTEGQEQFFVWQGEALRLAVAFGNSARELLQLIRDEAHRFAVTGHRAKRSKHRIRSTLEDLPGIGKKRRQLLLQHFGGLTELKQASVEQIAAVEGIGPALAASIFQALHA